MFPEHPSPRMHLFGLFLAHNPNKCVFAEEGGLLLDYEAEVGGEQGRHL
jgi:hypothetical protein